MEFLRSRINQHHANQVKKYLDYALHPVCPTPIYLDLAIAQIQLIKNN